ncbi:nuclear transport factor 2 family protein [Jiangella asiatica]|nr:nuclear transport factor 2 family protein [Jiangella asiatica]
MTTDDHADVRDLMSAVAYVLDSHEYDRLGEVFAADVHFENPGRLVADGLPALIEAFKGIADPAISHHVTNVVVTPVDATTATCRMKALALRSGGVLTAAEYTDTVRKEATGWRIASRHIRPLG